jgi:ATP-dependent DNA helicase RecG
MNAKELFEQLQKLDESPTIEAKRASSFGESLMQTICAFANEPGLHGGYLLLGVMQDDTALFPGFYKVIGLDDPDKLVGHVNQFERNV